jgi:hypothetical protein
MSSGKGVQACSASSRSRRRQAMYKQSAPRDPLRGRCWNDRNGRRLQRVPPSGLVPRLAVAYLEPTSSRIATGDEARQQAGQAEKAVLVASISRVLVDQVHEVNEQAKAPRAGNLELGTRYLDRRAFSLTSRCSNG